MKNPRPDSGTAADHRYAAILKRLPLLIPAAGLAFFLVPVNRVIDSCAPAAAIRSPGGDTLSTLAIGAVVLSLVCYMASERTRAAVAACALGYGVYLCSHIASRFLKILLSDTRCSDGGHGNAVSGHINLMMYASLFLATVTVTARSTVVRVMGSAALALCAATAAYTFLAGYHTLRQCALGAALGASAFYLFRQLRSGVRHRVSAAIVAMSLMAGILVLWIMTSGRLPKTADAVAALAVAVALLLAARTETNQR